ncbi:hypothetical protein [Chromobacterium violaceum]|uniref:hypothetical protein n=1 Tax=Chromobacterium violaceum TaxID=536 RepID=UPI0005B9318F|nr:hypothetical protein [Chromobacterium violaceum]
MSKRPKQQLEKCHSELTLRITDGEHDLPMGRARINWEAPPPVAITPAPTSSLRRCWALSAISLR